MATTETIVLGSGCFWCAEAVFARVPGVASVMPGYAGWESPDPDYESVCSGSTGHAEVVLVGYDPGVVRLEDLLAVFFRSHDPTTPNRQGADVGTQYRSIILAESDGALDRARAYAETLRPEYRVPIVTEIRRLGKFHEAEPEHHRYFERHPERTYCALVIAPKLVKVFSS